MSTQTISQAENLLEMIDRMPADSILVQHGVGWEDHEELLQLVGEASGLRISYNEGRLQILTLSPKHEKFADLIKLLVGLLAVRLRVRVLFYGSSTIKKQPEQKGAEPDGCFYVQKAGLVGRKDQIDFRRYSGGRPALSPKTRRREGPLYRVRGSGGTLPPLP